MPVALERALKRKVAGKKMSKERKNAYIYGTLRKTGWKPKRELSAMLDSIIEFAQDPLFYRTLEHTGWKPRNIVTSKITSDASSELYEKAKAANAARSAYPGPFQSISGNTVAPNGVKRRIGIGVGTLAAAGGAGWWLGKKHEENKRNQEFSAIEFDQNDYVFSPGIKKRELAGGAAGLAAGIPVGVLAQKGLGHLIANSNVDAETFEDAVRKAARRVKLGNYAALGAGIGTGMLAARAVRKHYEKKDQQYSSTGKPIEFGAEILAPWQGSTGHTSKIDQLEFPNGLSPAMAMQFPLPVLMRYLNQRNIMQQQFSWKTERLIRLSAQLDEIHASAHPTQ